MIINIITFIKLIRFKNLLIICLMNFLIKFFIINQSFKDTALSNFHFCIYLITLICIIAGGYIINDIYDVKIDKINKPKDIIISDRITIISAWKTYRILNIGAVISCIYLVIVINKLWLSSFFLFFIFSLWMYSKKYKTSFLFGNLLIAFLTSFSIINLVLFDLIPLYSWEVIKSSQTFNIIIVYTSFCFLVTLIREIIKDIEDVDGDNYYKANTLVIRYGKKKTKKILHSIIIVTIFSVAYIQFLLLTQIFDNHSNLQISFERLLFVLYILTFTIIIQLQLNILLKKLVFAKEKSHYTYLTKLCKLIMLVGILSIPFITFFLKKL